MTTATSPATAPALSRRFTRPQWGAIWLFMLCQFLVILDGSGLNVALPSIGRDFGVPIAQTGAVNLGFVVALAVMIPLSGWLGERIGTVRVLRFGLVVLVLGSIVSALATSLEVVIVGRVIQGIGGGGLMPLAASLLFRNFEPAQRLRVTAAMSLPVSLAPTLGPLIGGLLVDHLSWRWVFLVSIPISAAAFFVGLLVAKEAQNRAVRRLDLLGAMLTMIGFGGAVFGIERLATREDVLVGAISLALGAIALMVLIPYELRKGPAAFLDVALLRRKTFARMTSITALHAVAFMGFGLAGPLLLQTQLDLGAFDAGLVGISGAIGTMITGRFARPLIMRIGAKAALIVSQAGMLVGLCVIVLGYGTDVIWVISLGVFLGGGFGFLTIMTTQTVGFSAVPHTNLGDATAIDGTSRQVGSAFGIAAVAGALAAASTLGAATLGTVCITLGVLAVFHLAAIAVAAAPGRLPLPGRDADVAAVTDLVAEAS